MDAQAAFLAQAVRQMTPRQCTQLIELAKEWLASNDYWRSGMIRSFARDVKAAIFLIPRNGKTPTDDFRTAESSLDPNFDSTDQSTEAAEGHLTSNDFSYAQPLAPLAIERILITEAAIEESYSGLAQLLRDPFITFTEHLASPKWLRFVLDETSAVRLNSAASDHEFKRVSNILRRNAVRWRMLMLHASIQKFKWEHDRLPDKLGELHLPAYSINPAMNRPFNYTLTPIGYSLTCTEFASPEGEEYEEGPDSMVMDLLADRIRDRHYTY